MIGRIGLLLALAVTFGGCTTPAVLSSIAGGESKVFEAPPYVVKGKAEYDQQWIDRQVEGGVAAFHWSRPKPRPPEIDRQAAPRVPVPKKKPSMFQRVKARVVGRPVEAVPYLQPPPSVVAPPAVAPAVAPPARPLDPLEELLGSK